MTLACAGGEFVQVPADIRRGLAVHAAHEGSPGIFTITHAATGLSLVVGMSEFDAWAERDRLSKIWDGWVAHATPEALGEAMPLDVHFHLERARQVYEDQSEGESTMNPENEALFEEEVAAIGGQIDCEFDAEIQPRHIHQARDDAPVA